MNVPTPRTRNITAAYRAASEQDRQDGREWYGRARVLAEELDPRDIERAAAVIAVLSPRMHWHKNVELARYAYRHQCEDGMACLDVLADWPGLKSNGRKALGILAGADPEDVVSGPKVRAFWRTICDPIDPRAVVVDRHALDVACGRVLDDETRGRILGRAGAYDTVCDLYRRAARILSKEYGVSLSPAVVQATTWVYWRRERVAGQGALLSRDSVR